MYKTDKRQFKKDNTIYNTISAEDMYYIDYEEEVIKSMRTNIEAADEILDLYFPVLDHGFVALKDYMGGDESIELAARTSYGKGTRKQSDTETLIRYLYRNRHCYHPNMEVLTIDGWKKWKDCLSSEMFAVPNVDTNTFTFEKLEVLTFDYEGDMHEFYNERMSYSVTPNHTMYFKPKLSSSFERVQVQNMKKWGHFKGTQNFKFIHQTVGDEVDLLEGKFAGFFLGDGYWENNSSIGFRIQKQRKIQYLDNLLLNLNIEHTKEIKDESGDKVAQYRLKYPPFLLNYTVIGQNCYTKQIICDYNSISQQSALGLLDGLKNSDGHTKKDRPQIEYSSASEELVKSIQTLAIMLGMDCHKRKSLDDKTNRITIHTQGLDTIESRKQFHSISEYSGNVHCATSPTGLLMVRGSEDEFGFICGNTTPFEMTELTFHIGMPIFVARQYFRHRTFNFNEYSGRYSEIPDIFYTPELSRITKQSKDNKQGSSDELVYDIDGYEDFLENRSCGPTFLEYKDRLEEGWAKELARIDLPLSTYTYFYCKVDLHNLLHFLKLRTDSHAQKEIRDFADVIAGMTKRVAPLAYQAWIDYAYCAKLFTRLDILLLQWCNDNLNHCPVDEWDFNYMCICGTGIEKPHEKIGMGKRELEEFWTKLNPVTPPEFELDLSTATKKA